MKIKKKHIFRFFGPFFSSFIIFGWDFVENEKNHQKSTVILLHFWLSKQKNYFWSHAKLAKMSSFQCTVGGGYVEPDQSRGNCSSRNKKSQNKRSFERKNPSLLSLKNGISFSASFPTCYFRPIKSFDKRVIWRRSSISFWIRSSNTRVKEMITSLLDNLPPLRGCVWVRALSTKYKAIISVRCSEQ